MKFTHYVDTPGPMVLAFELGNCETCCNPVRLANGLRMRRADAFKLRLILTQYEPSELYCDEDGNDVCDNCAE